MVVVVGGEMVWFFFLVVGYPLLLSPIYFSKIPFRFFCRLNTKKKPLIHLGGEGSGNTKTEDSLGRQNCSSSFLPRSDH